MTPPVSSSKRRRVSASSGAAPEKQSFTDLNAGRVLSASGWLMMAVSSVGTAQRKAGRSRRIVASSPAVSRGLATRVSESPLPKASVCTPALP